MFLLLLACAADLPADPESAIERHLIAVETGLRATPVDHLAPETQARRAALLNALHAYHLKGAWPQPPADTPVRERPVPVEGGYAGPEGSTPLFVDVEGRHCAVGHLLDVADYDPLVAQVVARDNGAFLHELLDDPTLSPELSEAAAEMGFTLEELARIQPTYDFERLELLVVLPPFSGTCDAEQLTRYVTQGQEASIPEDYVGCLEAKVTTALASHEWHAEAQEALIFMMHRHQHHPHQAPPEWFAALTTEVLLNPEPTLATWAYMATNQPKPDFYVALRTLDALHPIIEARPLDERAALHAHRLNMLSHLSWLPTAPEEVRDEARERMPAARCALEAAQSGRSAAEACAASPAGRP